MKLKERRKLGMKFIIDDAASANGIVRITKRYLMVLE